MSTITVELCGGNRKGIEKQDFDANKPDNENYITINLVPEKYKLSNLKITVGLLNQDWEAIEADKYKLELQWSRVYMFYFSAGTVVKVVDTGDNQYYGYTKLIATNTDICDLLSIVVTGSKSGDFHQFVPYVVDDGLIGSSYEPPPFEHFASLIPGEVLWLTYRFRRSPGFGTVTTGYRAPGITGGTITDRQWHIENLVYIYEVYYEGLTGWFFNSQCTVLNKGQWVFLNTDLATSLENGEDFSIPYGTELDNAKSFILPMRIQGHGPPCDIWFNQSKYYSNIRYAKAIINNIDRNTNSAYYICSDLGIEGSCGFYCQGPDIDPESGDQFLIGDTVLLMVGGNASASGPYANLKIIGRLPFTIKPLRDVVFIYMSNYFYGDLVAHNALNFFYTKDLQTINFYFHKLGPITKVNAIVEGNLVLVDWHAMLTARDGMITLDLVYGDKSRSIALIPYRPGYERIRLEGHEYEKLTAISWDNQVNINWSGDKIAFCVQMQISENEIKFVNPNSTVSHNAIMFQTYVYVYDFVLETLAVNVYKTPNFRVDQEYTVIPFENLDMAEYIESTIYSGSGSRIDGVGWYLDELTLVKTFISLSGSSNYDGIWYTSGILYAEITRTSDASVTVGVGIGSDVSNAGTVPIGFYPTPVAMWVMWFIPSYALWSWLPLYCSMEHAVLTRIDINYLSVIYPDAFTTVIGQVSAGLRGCFVPYLNKQVKPYNGVYNITANELAIAYPVYEKYVYVR